MQSLDRLKVKTGVDADANAIPGKVLESPLRHTERSIDQDLDHDTTLPELPPPLAESFALNLDHNKMLPCPSEDAGKLQQTQIRRESRVRETWDERLISLKEFKAKHGHMNVPRNYAPNPSLGTFVTNQRQTYKRMTEGKGPKMNIERVRQLQDLGFKFVLSHTDEHKLEDEEYKQKYHGVPSALSETVMATRRVTLDWDEGLAGLKKYRKETGNFNVPHIFAANPPLGNFVKNIRYEYKHKFRNDKSSKMLTKERVIDLEKMGFQLVVRQREPWSKRFNELREYVQEHGNCDVNKETPLGIWCLNQRSHYKLSLKNEPSQLTVNRIKLLNSVGFDWRVSKNHKYHNAATSGYTASTAPLHTAKDNVMFGASAYVPAPSERKENQSNGFGISQPCTNAELKRSAHLVPPLPIISINMNQCHEMTSAENDNCAGFSIELDRKHAAAVTDADRSTGVEAVLHFNGDSNTNGATVDSLGEIVDI